MPRGKGAASTMPGLDLPDARPEGRRADDHPLPSPLPAAPDPASAGPVPPGYRMTELGPLPQEWQVVRLGEVLTEVDIRLRDLQNVCALPVLSLTKNDGLVLQTDRFGKRIATEDLSMYKVVYRGQIVYNPYVIWEGAIHILSKQNSGLVSPVGSHSAW